MGLSAPRKGGSPAGIGFVIYIPPTDTAQAGKWYWSGATVDSEFISQFGVKKQYIGQLELLAAVAVYHTVAAHPQLKSQFQGAPVIHFIDNYAAAAGLTKGYSAATASSRVVHAFWALVGSMKCAHGSLTSGLKVTSQTFRLACFSLTSIVKIWTFLGAEMQKNSSCPCRG